ncbi:MAG: lipoate--protein ligase, partial [Candidatus Rokubacteria bacterium]|nr:lipoate--protein ligase [Candidatus Rokubacteria bacterium]
MSDMGWRYMRDDGVTASFGLAADEVITRRQGTGTSPPTLRLYTYRSHCALVGRFQRVRSEIHLDYCRANGIAVNRRPTGGGAILMGEDQLGVAVMVPERADARSYDRTRELFQRFSGGIIEALASLGVAAEYRRKNDVEVRGRKVAGLGIYFDPA